MKFERIQDRETTVIHPRVALILYGFNTKEIMQIKNIARVIGIKEIIEANKNKGNATLRNLLEDEEVLGELEDMPKEKAILFNSLPPQKVNAVIDTLKKYRMAKPLYAVVTEHSIDWTLKKVLDNLKEERDTLGFKHD